MRRLLALLLLLLLSAMRSSSPSAHCGLLVGPLPAPPRQQDV
jgi:hypothetical protein